jgi:signal transduction histidine kinase
MRKAEPLSAATGYAAARSEPDRSSSPRSLLADLLALRELQASLALEESDEAVIRVGANAIVEILTLDGGLVLVDGFGPRPEIRFGWRQGRTMATREIEGLARALGRELSDVRAGRCGNLLLSTRAGTSAPAATVPAAAREMGFAAVLILGLGSGGRRSGALVLASRDQDAFSGEQMILAEILASQMSEQCERVRLHEATEAIEPRVREATERATRGLLARIAAMEAQAAIASAAAQSIDAERQLDLVLKKAIEVGKHRAGAILLVETNDAGDDLMRFASGQGDAAWLERARLPRWRCGEGLAGSVWESGQGAVVDLGVDAAGFDGEAMRRAGYHRLCCEPLRARGRVIGVLVLLGDEAKPYEEAERALLRAVAEQVGVSIDNARLLGDVMRHSLDLEWQVERLSTERARSAHDRSLLIDLALSAAGGHPLDQRAAEMLERAIEFLGVDAAALFAHDASASTLRLVDQRGLRQEAVEALRERPARDAVLGGGLAGEQEAIVDLASSAVLKDAPWARRLGFRHLAVVPCRAQGATRGVLVVASRFSGSPNEEGLSARASAAALFGLVLLEAESGRRPTASDAISAAGGSTSAPLPREDPRTPGDRPSEDRHARDEVLPSEGPRRTEDPRALDRRVLARAQKMDSLSTLAPDIAHDVNNTLGAIMGYASHIRDLVPDHNPVHGEAAVIVDQTQRVADIARQVLSYAQGETAGRQPTSVRPLIDGTIALLARTLGPTIEIEVRCPENLPQVEADPGQIRQALINLAMNARDAMPNGGRLVFEGRSGHIDAPTAASMPALVPGDFVSIVVQDGGTGMSEEIARHAFDPFFTTKETGRGLGLTIVQDIAREHAGHVALHTVPGVGTAVRLYVPASPGQGTRAEGSGDTAHTAPRAVEDWPVPAAIAEVDGDLGESTMDDLCVATATTLSLQAGIDPGGRPRRILVVDDEPVLAEMAAEVLKSRGFEVLVAGDGVAALEVYRQEWGKIGLVLLDMIMPRLGGLETCRRLLGMDRNARVLICSGYSNSQQAQEAIKEGALGLLPKPFDMRELIAWVEKGLRS